MLYFTSENNISFINSFIQLFVQRKKTEIPIKGKWRLNVAECDDNYLREVGGRLAESVSYHFIEIKTLPFYAAWLELV